MSIAANNPTLTSWVEVPANSDFPIQNLPFGIIKVGNGKPRVASRIGDFAIDLKALFVLGYFENMSFELEDFDTDKLNSMMKKGKDGTRKLRDRLSKLFQSDKSDLSSKEHHVNQVLISMDEVTMLMPITIGDYTDFYSSEQHAYNVGCMFRDPDNALMPNWKHLPVAYHGRASSIVVSGTPFHRPKGQQKPADENPVFGPCKLLDFELEMGFITYDGKPLGDSISTSEADDYIFGMCLFNDWSARDIQKWEYIPLGPFLAKNFASHMSPWIVTLDALENFRTSGPVQDPKVLPYLEYEGDKHIEINLQVAVQPKNADETIVSNSNYKYMYWNMNQQLAHHTVNGCNVNAGDLMASGTISGPNEGEYGSMLEIAWQGTKPVKMADGTERKFINDHDTVIMRGVCERDGLRIGFGEVRAELLPAK